MKIKKHVLIIEEGDLDDSLNLKDIGALCSREISLVILPEPLTRKDVEEKEWVRIIKSAIMHPESLCIMNTQMQKKVPIYIPYEEDNRRFRHKINNMEKSKITVTPEQVKENMQDVIVRTETEFGKPCTYVTVRMKNGFTLRESTTCVDPANYDEEIGKKICLEKIEDKVWFLLGYALQDKVANEPKGFFERLVKEHEELSIRLAKLTEYLGSTSSSAIINKIGGTQYELLLKQESAMSLYQEILYNRIKRLEENK